MSCRLSRVICIFMTIIVPAIMLIFIFIKKQYLFEKHYIITFFAIAICIYSLLLFFVSPLLNKSSFPYLKNNFDTLKNITALVSIMSLITVINTNISIDKKILTAIKERGMPSFYIEIDTRDINYRFKIAYKNLSTNYMFCVFSRDPSGILYAYEGFLIKSTIKDIYFREIDLPRKDKYGNDINISSLRPYIINASCLSLLSNDFYQQTYSNRHPEKYYSTNSMFIIEIKDVVYTMNR